jgi:hypothetical protein
MYAPWPLLTGSWMKGSKIVGVLLQQKSSPASAAAAKKTRENMETCRCSCPAAGRASKGSGGCHC